MAAQQMKALGAPEDRGLPKAILCIHGAGSSGDIFRIQLTKIRTALKHEFDFVFVNGPHLTSPGPGVLPWFEGAGPYYSWFKEEDATMERRLEQINDAVKDAQEQWDSTKKNPHSRIVGVMAFSEGSLAATMLLWQQSMGRLPWLSTLHFATLMCCYFRQEAAEYMCADLAGEEKALINVPTLHVHGKRDFCLAGARRLVANHYLSEYAQVMEFDGTHHVPMKREDVDRAVRLVLRLSCAVP
ncbi:esterase mlcF [Colletotrichum spaethianum]|uniref:Esterase mlcF n=1 Tax=Colletotrichum spaethianum TaxID=700344 RepID=A0AA37UJT9_9PEZI|nr:esterase mlcF [Colletotrichum spaethianum]GKT48781.1 esterase mlcF [Colletotrichum spaethianum]